MSSLLSAQHVDDGRVPDCVFVGVPLVMPVWPGGRSVLWSVPAANLSTAARTASQSVALDHPGCVLDLRSVRTGPVLLLLLLLLLLARPD